MDLTNTIPTAEERIMLISMAQSSVLDYETKEATIEWISCRCNNYATFQLMTFKLEDVQPSFNMIPNPSMSDLNKFVRQVAKNI
jgi:hypothetical protein